jgi:hypothetical protein
MIGFAAERLWGAKRWTAIALIGAFGAELWAKIVQPIGAGNSVAVFSLAASIAFVAVLRGVGMQRLLGLISSTGFGLSDLPPAVGFQVVVMPGVGSQVADSGLAWWPGVIGGGGRGWCDRYRCAG